MNALPCWIQYGTNEQNVKFVKEKLVPALSLNIKCWMGGLPDYKQYVKKHFPEMNYYSQTQFNQLADVQSGYDDDFFELYDRSFVYELDNIFRRFKFDYNYETPFDEQNHCLLVARSLLARLKEDKVKLVIFFEYPHAVGSYLTYLVCKFLGIKVIIRTLSPFESRTFYVENLDEGIPMHYQEMNDDQREDFEKVLLKATRSYSEAQPEYTRKQNQRYFLVSRLRKFAVFMDQQRWKRALRSLVDTSFVPPKGKFVYVGLHYQPELTSFPLGGFYNNQYLMILMLSSVVPDDWKIIVKEHPSIFRYVKKNVTLYRSAQYYASIKNIPKVELVDFTHDSFGLIDASACIATLTGTIGFEGVLRGKPCLVFGQASYVGCEGVNKVASYRELKQAFDELIESNFHVDKNKVLEFATRAISNTVRSKTNRDYDKFDEEQHLDFITNIFNSQQRQTQDESARLHL